MEIAFVLFLLTCVLFYLRVKYLRQYILQIIEDRGGPLPETSAEIHDEWYNLSWNLVPGGPQPLRVIKLGWAKAVDEWTTFQENTHLTSCYYSQVKYLLRMGQLPTAIVFFLRSQYHRDVALEHAGDEVKAQALEVLGAPDFKLAHMPLIGLLWEKRALRYLKEAEQKLPRKRNRTDGDKLDAAIIWSKLYVLTKDEVYKDYIRRGGLNQEMDNNQLRRIAGYLGMTFDEFSELCGFPLDDITMS